MAASMKAFVLFTNKLASVSDHESMMYLLSQISKLYGQCYRFYQLTCLQWLKVNITLNTYKSNEVIISAVDGVQDHVDRNACAELWPKNTFLTL